MVRKRVPLQLIPKDTSRRRTYRSRKNNLMKKAHEFRTLCGVSTCVIIYDPEGPAKNPETYPEDRNEVVEVIEKYISTGGKRKMIGLPKFFEDRKKKVENELKKTREDNLKAKFPLPRDLIESLPRDQLRSLCHEISARIVRAKNRLEGITGISMTSGDNNNNLGVGLNMIESGPSTWLPIGVDSQFGGDASWCASNKANLVGLPSTQNYYNIPPIQCQYPGSGQDQYLGNPNGCGTDYTSSRTFYNPTFLQYKPHSNLFTQQPQPVMNYTGPTSFTDLPPLPPWQGAEKPGPSHNFDQYNYGAYGNADVALSGMPLPAPAAKMEWQKEQSSSSADMSSFFNQYY